MRVQSYTHVTAWCLLCSSGEDICDNWHVWGGMNVFSHYRFHIGHLVFLTLQCYIVLYHV